MTISEIAKLAGVSSSAVSRYLNGGSLSEEKRERIGKVIEEQNYVPSYFARSLRTKRSHHVGVIVPKISSEAVSRMVSGIAEVLSVQGYQFFLADTRRDIANEIHYMEEFQNSQIDGIIFLGTVMTKKHRDMLQNAKVPVVVLGQDVDKCSCVFHDDEHAAYDLGHMLMESGCRKPACIFAPEKDRAAGYFRMRGVKMALEDHGLQAEDFVTEISGFSMKDGQKAMGRILDNHPDIDGVFCATDTIAIGAMLELKKRKYVIPDQVRICGIGDNTMSDIIEPKLTTVHYYYENSGRDAARILLSMIEAKDQETIPVKQLMLSYEVVRKDTL